MIYITISIFGGVGLLCMPCGIHRDMVHGQPAMDAVCVILSFLSYSPQSSCVVFLGKSEILILPFYISCFGGYCQFCWFWV